MTESAHGPRAAAAAVTPSLRGTPVTPPPQGREAGRPHAVATAAAGHLLAVAMVVAVHHHAALAAAPAAVHLYEAVPVPVALAAPVTPIPFGGRVPVRPHTVVAVVVAVILFTRGGRVTVPHRTAAAPAAPAISHVGRVGARLRTVEAAVVAMVAAVSSIPGARGRMIGRLRGGATRASSTMTAPAPGRSHYINPVFVDPKP